MFANAPNTRPRRSRTSGLALIGAIAFLMLFAMLGTAYVGYMSLEFEEAGNYLHDVRARQLAADGIYAAIGELEDVLRQQAVPEDAYRFELASYRQEVDGVGNYPQTVDVRVQDEAARLNINAAPLPVLEALGFDSAAIDALDSLRSAPGNGRLVSVGALRAQDILTAQQFQALDTGLLTVYTAEDPRQPHSYINLNSASPRVLAALFAIDLPEARALAGKRPFRSWADVLQKVGREPVSFNVPVARHAPREMPQSLAFDSNCYRLTSSVAFDMPGGTGRPVRTAVEAVVVFHQGGGYTIRYWKERRGFEAQAVSTGDAADTPSETKPNENQENENRNGTSPQEPPPATASQARTT